MDKLKMESRDNVQGNIEKIRELFPNCVTEVLRDGKPTLKVDFDILKQEMSDTLIDDKEERYQFTWPDKKKSILLANTPINATLRPCKAESVDFDNTENLYIEGDNLDVLKLLQETYLGKIKMIYIDPPYNTGRDSFVYNDNFNVTYKDYLANAGVYDESGNILYDVRANNIANGRFHTDWLNMIYPRLKVAKDLLSDDGVIFISIDDNEVENLKKICNEVFGEDNFIGCAGRITKKSNNKGDFWAPNFDYLLTYTKNRESAVEFTGGANIDSYNLIETDGPRKGERYQLVRLYMSSLQNRNPEQRFWIDCPDGSKIIPPGTTFPPERPNLGDGIWRWSRATFEANKDKIVIKQVKSSNLLNENKEPAKWNVFTKTYLNDVLDKNSAKPNSFIEEYINQIASHELGELGIPFDYAKPTPLIKYLMNIAQIKNDDIILDFFSGSASTADAIMRYNAEDGGKRKFIMVQLPEKCDENSEAYKAGYKNICEIGKERIRRAGKKIVEPTNLLEDLKNVDIGFRVLKLDSSNMKDVYYKPSEYTQSLLDSLESNIKEDRTPLDLLFQVMLDLGKPLSAKIEEKEITGKHVYIVNDDDLIACFDDGITEEVVKEIAKKKPLFAVFRDSGLSSDSTSTNFDQIFATYSPNTTRRVL
ncbi:MAG: site-specific DNA-methyltransferase [Clostridia bacterium]|nr:site-specific DNA-methyltransferase [Clostridia bacterium]